jgi:hypothetical protein
LIGAEGERGFLSIPSSSTLQNKMSNKENDTFYEALLENSSEPFLSNCCSAPVNEDYMICSHCFEHCGIAEIE